jgi:hypothetical protein
VLRALLALWLADIDLVLGSISSGSSVKVSGDSMAGGYDRVDVSDLE